MSVGTPTHIGPARWQRLEKHDPFWGPQLIVAGAVLLDLSLSEKLTIGPNWLLPSLESLALIAPISASPHPRMRHSVLRWRIAIALIGLVSIVNSVSLVLLGHYLLRGGTASGHALIGSGMVLWVTNVLLFGLWYWELDRGAPLCRAEQADILPDFLLVQMTVPEHTAPDWEPGLIDCLIRRLRTRPLSAPPTPCH